MQNRLTRYFALIAAAGLAVSGCSRGSPNPYETIAEVPLQAKGGSSEPHFYMSPDEQLYLTWLEPEGDDQHALRYSRFEEGVWSTPVTIASGANWFLHFADLPSMATLRDGSVAAQWLEMDPDEPGMYGVRIRVSRDGGNEWSAPIQPHRSPRNGEFGFVSMVPYPDDRFLVVWLDGRSAPRSTALRMAYVSPLGRVFKNAALDKEVCECCSTDAARTSTGVVIVYRDRSPENWRDISIVRITDGRIHSPRIVYPDRWRIMSCPVNGPAVDAFLKDVVVAWYTEASGPMVKVAFSSSGGEFFDRPITVAAGAPVRGRVDVALMPDGSATVCWVEQPTGQNTDNLLALRVWPDRKTSDDPVKIVEGAAGLSGCQPQVMVVGARIVFAWTDPSDPTMVKTAVGDIKSKD